MLTAGHDNMKTVLVVDDEFLIADLLAVTLEENGYRVIKANHGKKALDAICAQPPHLIITDFMMPLMNGLELAQAVKANSVTSNIPIILVSAAEGAIARNRTDLFVAVYDKPFDVLDVLAKVSQLIGSQL